MHSKIGTCACSWFTSQWSRQEVTSCNSGPCQNRLEWFAGPWGQCSAECGNGTQTRRVACILQNKGRTEVVAPVKCSATPQPITAQPCTLKLCGVRWYVTAWSTCSRSCNGSFRAREVRCLTDNVAPSEQCDPARFDPRESRRMQLTAMWS
ncbi:thrombospondin type-1 domain-containing protein 4 isoform X2 [Phyllopteryx taeniolatus]|uniref:thrombospondin type-1 domain-containing protein 4 isoform X2 n=1 Tax=Phyllopteryx taeniolatus TaxID=161469 RepID=UPI002AD5917F|nr:thrombospondin type-1 domain-containing protein 4 isoform X2 [Phyllopteryx taeniolatus]